MNTLLLVPLVFFVVLVAELPDKSMFASLVLGTKFRPQWVFLGVTTAFVVHVVIAVTAGGLLTLLPHRVLQIVVAVLFLVGAGYMWLAAGRESNQEDDKRAAAAGEGDEPPTSRRALTAVGTSFVVIFVGEWGDITQIVTANLAAKYNQPYAVGLGAVLGLCAAALLALTLGQTLLTYVSVTLLHRVGAVLLLGFALYSTVLAPR